MNKDKVGPQVTKTVVRQRVKNAHRKHCTANGYVPLKKWAKSYVPVSDHDNLSDHIETWFLNKSLVKKKEKKK